MMILAAYRIDWTEYESGWGCRPDGSSLHRDLDAAKAFISRYGTGTGHEFSRPNADPRLVEITEDQKRRLDESETGTIWLNRGE